MKLTEYKLRSVIKQELVKFLNEMDETGMVPRAPSEIPALEIPSGHKGSRPTNKAYMAQKSSEIATKAKNHLIDAKQIIENKQRLDYLETSSFQSHINSAIFPIEDLKDQRFRNTLEVLDEIIDDTYNFLRDRYVETKDTFQINSNYLPSINTALKILDTIMQSRG